MTDVTVDGGRVIATIESAPVAGGRWAGAVKAVLTVEHAGGWDVIGDAELDGVDRTAILKALAGVGHRLAEDAANEAFIAWVRR